MRYTNFVIIIIIIIIIITSKSVQFRGSAPDPPFPGIQLINSHQGLRRWRLAPDTPYSGLPFSKSWVRHSQEEVLTGRMSFTSEPTTWAVSTCNGLDSAPASIAQRYAVLILPTAQESVRRQ